MSKRSIACLTAVFFVALAGSAAAQEQASIVELKRLQAALTVINLELKSDLDQIQMLQEAARINLRSPLDSLGRSPDPVMVEDVAATQRRAIERETAINARLDAILARNAALDARKQLMLERVREIGLATAATPVPTAANASR